ncbi:MAG TPA: alpha/beta fold hydrolase [Acidimicrobiales bacterium]|nr:alpha/beta fold hydrolase [Acidimicrobiales bacterium]
MALHVELRGSGQPLILLHGFTQTGRLWGRFGDQLADSYTLVAIDLPGHAGSDAVRADLPETAGLVADAVRAAVGDRPCGLAGYSLGARVALHVLTQSDLPVNRAVLIGATGGIEDPEERTERRRSDGLRADELEASGDVGAFLESWLRGPLFERLGEGADRDERRRNSAPGLASSLRLCGTGTQEPLWDAVAAIRCPILALAGTDDTRFAAHALRLARLAGHGVASLVPGGGHAVHLAQPGHTGRIVTQWLRATDPDPPAAA